MKSTRIDTGVFQDLEKRVPKISHGTFALPDGPRAQLSGLLDVVITFWCDKDIGIPFRLRGLMRYEQFDGLAPVIWSS